MERKVNVQSWQKITLEDFNNFGEFPRLSFDHLVGDTIIPDMAYTGFAVTESAASEIEVAGGRLFAAGKVYYNDSEGGTTINLASVRPATTQKYVAVVTWGTETDTDTEPRTFLTDATTRATVARAIATESRRWANISTVAGVEAPDPVKPSLAANVLAVAWVLMDASGIVSITMDEDNVAPNLREADTRLNENDDWRTRIGTRIDTLASDLAGLAARLTGTARQSFVLDVARDLADVKDQIDIPSAFTQWAVDNFLTNDESDTEHVDWLAFVEEGVRFPDAASHSAQIGLQNQYDAGVSVTDYFVLPAYDEVARISVRGADTEQAISQYQYQTVLCTHKHRSRHRHRFGSCFRPCSAYHHWHSRHRKDCDDTTPVPYHVLEQIFRNPLVVEVWRNWEADEAHWSEERDHWKHHHKHRGRHHWFDKYEQPYWIQIVSTESINGSIFSQTFLNAQDGWLTSFDFFFTRVAAAGDVTVLLCETVSGAPALDKVIQKVVIPQASMRTYPTPTPCDFIPAFLSEGVRYAFAFVTPGNHYCAMTINNKYAQGTSFWSTDGIFVQGDLTKDIAFVAKFAQFDSPRVEVQLQNLELTGGIQGIDILADAFEPPQTQIIWEVNVNGVWVDLAQQEGAEPHPLNGLPTGAQFRAVLLGTTDSMPGFGVGVNSRVLTRRQGPNFRHISVVRTPSVNIDTVYLDVRLEAWRGAPYHTFTPKILTGATYATVETPDVTEEVLAPDDPQSRVMKYTFTLAGEVADFRIRLEGTTDNVLTCFQIAKRTDVDINAA